MQKKSDKNIGLAVWIGGISVLSAALILLSNLFLGGIYYDLTSDGRYSLDSGTEDFLKQNKQPVAVRLYLSKDLIGQNQVLGYYAGYVRRLLEEYQRRSSGTIDLSIVEVVPFASSQAAAETAGIKAFDSESDNKYLYLGASFTNSSGQTLTIPQFLPQRQKNIEDDLTRILSVLTNGKRPVLGVISPVFKIAGNSVWLNTFSDWPFIGQMKGWGYDIRPLKADNAAALDGVDAVLVFYPVNLKANTLYALDQYLLNGGRIIMVPDAFSDEYFRNAADYVPYDSGLKEFLQNKGIAYVSNMLAGDLDNSRELVAGGQKKKYPFWLTAKAGKKTLFLNHSGFFNYTPQEGFSTKVLSETGLNGAQMPAVSVLDADIGNIDGIYEKSSGKKPLVLLLEGNFTSVFDEPQVVLANTPDYASLFLEKSKNEGKLLLVADSDMFNAPLWNGNLKRGQGLYEADFISDNVHFLRDMADYLTNSGLAGAEPKSVNIKSRSLSDVFYKYAADGYEQEKTEISESLAEIREQAAVLRAKLSSAPVASVKQTKDLEQLTRDEIEKQESLRRISYQTDERYKNLMSYFSFFMIGILPLLMVLLSGGCYELYRSRAKRKAERYVNA